MLFNKNKKNSTQYVLEISSAIFCPCLSKLNVTCYKTAEEISPARKKSEEAVLSPKLSRAATTIAEEAVDQLQASEKLIAGMCTFSTEIHYNAPLFIKILNCFLSFYYKRHSSSEKNTTNSKRHNIMKIKEIRHLSLSTQISCKHTKL